MNKNSFILFIFILFLTVDNAFGEELLITRSEHTEMIKIDGIMNTSEWKYSTEDRILNNGIGFAIRTAHDYENLFIMINFYGDKTIDRNSDRCIICFDANNDKKNKNDENNFCFINTLNGNNMLVIQGNEDFKSFHKFKPISNHPELIMAADKSSEDRYSKYPHPVYEFKIPLEIIGKNDAYGFYVNVYDASKDNFYTWPKETVTEKYPFIPTSDMWGTMLSPDKSIPEFEYYFIILLISITMSITILRFSKFGSIKFI